MTDIKYLLQSYLKPFLSIFAMVWLVFKDIKPFKIWRALNIWNGRYFETVLVILPNNKLVWHFVVKLLCLLQSVWLIPWSHWCTHIGTKMFFSLFLSKRISLVHPVTILWTVIESEIYLYSIHLQYKLYVKKMPVKKIRPEILSFWW